MNLQRTSVLQELRKSKLAKSLLGYLNSVKWEFLLAIISILGAIATDLLSPWPLKIVFDHVLSEHPDRHVWLISTIEAYTYHNANGILAFCALAIVCITALNGIFDYFETYMTSRVGMYLVRSLRKELFTHLQRLSLSFHTQASRGEVLTKVIGDTSTMRDVFTDYGITLVTDLLTLAGMFVIMLTINWQLSLLPLATLPLLIWISARTQRKIKVTMGAKRKKDGAIAAKLTESLASMPMVQAFGGENREIDKFNLENEASTANSVAIARTSAALSRTISVIAASGVALVVFWGAYSALHYNLSAGDLFLFVSYVKSMYKPIKEMVKVWVKVTQAAVSAQRIDEILSTEPEIQDKPDAIVVDHLKGEIVFDHVAFQYQNNQPILRGAYFRIYSGESVALVGGSGEGKSTIISLLLRLYDPTVGSIRIDGIDLRDYQRESLRKQIGLVLQDSFLFNTTFRENISYGRPDATQEEIEQASINANIHEFIIKQPKGYDTVIGEGGSTISGGQRQRIAIARALLKNPSILVMDEPTSSLDPKSKSQVQKTIDNLRGRHTILVVSHQLSAIQNFDRICVIQQGKIVEQGNHAELMALNGEYSKLYMMQNGAVETFGKNGVHSESNGAIQNTTLHPNGVPYTNGAAHPNGHPPANGVAHSTGTTNGTVADPLAGAISVTFPLPKGDKRAFLPVGTD